MMEDYLYDITIVGGGPAGMYAAFYSGMRGLKVKLIEGKGELGGFLHTYSEKTVWDVGGLPPMPASRLIVHLENQARTFQPELVFNQRIDLLERQEDGTLTLVADNGQRHRSRTVILTVGRGINVPKKLNMDDAELFERTNLHYAFPGAEALKDKHVLVSGGTYSAVDWAIQLAQTAKSVSVVHQCDVFAAEDESVAEMKEAAELLIPYKLESLHGEDGSISSVTLKHAETGDTEVMEVDAVLVSRGYSRTHGGVLEWGLTIGKAGVEVTEQAETNLPGIFAAGDCVSYGAKVKTIAGAFYDAMLAVNGAARYIDPKAPETAYVSTHNHRFRELERKGYTER